MPKIVLEVPGELTMQDHHDLAYLISDALDDFFHVRNYPDVEAYVRSKYYYMTDASHTRKVEEVTRRCLLARRLHNPALHVRIED